MKEITMIKETTDDILSCPDNSLIVNQVNALGFGAVGLMARIRNEYPEMFDEYHNLCSLFKTKNHQLELLGCIQSLKFKDTKKILCNVFTQKFITETKYIIDINSWKKVLLSMIAQIKNNEKLTSIKYEIHINYKIGNGMSQEEILNVRTLINNMFSNNDINLVYHT